MVCVSRFDLDYRYGHRPGLSLISTGKNGFTGLQSVPVLGSCEVTRSCRWNECFLMVSQTKGISFGKGPPELQVELSVLVCVTRYHLRVLKFRWSFGGQLEDNFKNCICARY